MRNITDIDDKIINRASELGINWKDLIKENIGRYYEDLKALRIERADFEPRATENIPDMVRCISQLIDKGYAYSTATGVYFRVRSFPGYGRLSGQSTEQMQSGVRKETDETKDDPLDFALWKRSKENEPFWESPWGKGRPGWHIECSVMSQKFLETDTLDIHAGGRDLIFPHHENEIAQSEALTGESFARCWVHHGLLTINGQKMSKSLGNFVAIKDFMQKYKNADCLKLFFLSAHYSHPIDYSEKKIEEARKQKKSFYDYFDRVNNRIPHEGRGSLPTSAEDLEKIDRICNKFHEAMDDDFNTPQALACLFELIDTGSDAASSDKEEAFRYIKSKLEIFFALFGLEVKQKKEIPAEDRNAIRERDRAREEKDFIRADEIRSTMELKYIVSDTNYSTTLIDKLLPEEENRND